MSFTSQTHQVEHRVCRLYYLLLQAVDPTEVTLDDFFETASWRLRSAPKLRPVEIMIPGLCCLIENCFVVVCVRLSYDFVKR